MRFVLSTVLSAALSSTAFAADVTVPVAGVLTDAGGVALEGGQSVTFTLRDGPGAGDALLFEATQTVAFVEGRFIATLGPAATLTPSDFANDPWLTVTLSGGPPSDPVRLSHAPRAAWAEHAATAAELSEPMPWSNLASIPAGFADGVDADTTYTAGAGLALSSTTFSVPAKGIVAAFLGSGAATSGQTLLADGAGGAAWGTISVPVMSAGSGLTLTGTALGVTTRGISAGLVGSGAATSGQTLLADGSGGAAWGTISVPVMSAGSGLTLTGTALGVTSGYVLGQVTGAPQTYADALGGRVPSGAAASCSVEGAIRYNTTAKRIEYCNGAVFVAVSANNRSCREILATGASGANGLYTINPSGTPYSAYCDFTTDGGGWTLVATKVSNAFVPWSATTSTACGASTTANCASRIPEGMPWSEALWRFSDVQDYYLVWQRTAYPEFASFLEGTSVNRSNIPVGGFRRMVNGVGTGPTVIASFYYGTGTWVSEQHQAGSDLWVDLWVGVDDVGNNYLYSVDAASRGQKCIAGYCKNEPVWFMVR